MLLREGRPLSITVRVVSDPESLRSQSSHTADQKRAEANNMRIFSIDPAGIHMPSCPANAIPCLPWKVDGKSVCTVCT
jgi:hypothetical protein